MAASLLFGAISAPYAEANLWKERRLAQLPASVIPAPAASSLSDAFPALSPQSLAERLPQNVKPDFSAVSAGPQRYAGILAALPPLYGTVRSIDQGYDVGISGRTVILIQDAHLNLDAQRNIGAALSELSGRGQAGLVALEGAFGEIDLNVVRKFPYPQTIRKSADFLLKQNKISGAAHMAMTQAGAIPPIIGVDDLAHYSAHLESYRKSVGMKDAAARRIETLEAAAEAEKQKVFNARLMEFDRKAADYRNRHGGLGAYVQALSEYSGAAAFPAIRQFVKAYEMERSLDFKAVEAERSALVKELTRALSQDQLSALLRHSVAYRMGRFSHGEYYSYLRNLCQASGVALPRFAKMDAYIRYVLLSESIDSEKLFAAMKEQENSIYARLAKTPEEKNLAARSRYLCLAGKLVRYSLSPSEWEEYEALKRGTLPSTGPAGESENSQGGVDLTDFEAFNREAKIRDGLMAENLLREMESRSAATAVLVAGGYHAPGLSKILNARGATVINFIPKIGKVDLENGAAYLGVFTQQKTPLERLFASPKLTIAQNPFEALSAADGSLPILAAADVARNGGDAMAALRYLGRSVAGIEVEAGDSRVTVTAQSRKSQKPVETVIEYESAERDSAILKISSRGRWTILYGIVAAAGVATAVFAYNLDFARITALPLAGTILPALGGFFAQESFTILSLSLTLLGAASAWYPNLRFRLPIEWEWKDPFSGAGVSHVNPASQFVLDLAPAQTPVEKIVSTLDYVFSLPYELIHLELHRKNSSHWNSEGLIYALKALLLTAAALSFLSGGIPGASETDFALAYVLSSLFPWDAPVQPPQVRRPIDDTSVPLPAESPLAGLSESDIQGLMPHLPMPTWVHVYERGLGTLILRQYDAPDQPFQSEHLLFEAHLRYDPEDPGSLALGFVRSTGLMEKLVHPYQFSTWRWLESRLEPWLERFPEIRRIKTLADGDRGRMKFEDIGYVFPNYRTGDLNGVKSLNRAQIRYGVLFKSSLGTTHETASGETVGWAVRSFSNRHTGVYPHLYDSQGLWQRYLIVFLNGKVVTDPETPLPEGAVIDLILMQRGGAPISAEEVQRGPDHLSLSASYLLEDGPGTEPEDKADVIENLLAPAPSPAKAWGIWSLLDEKIFGVPAQRARLNAVLYGGPKLETYAVMAVFAFSFTALFLNAGSGSASLVEISLHQIFKSAIHAAAPEWAWAGTIADHLAWGIESALVSQAFFSLMHLTGIHVPNERLGQIDRVYLHEPRGPPPAWALGWGIRLLDYFAGRGLLRHSVLYGLITALSFLPLLPWAALLMIFLFAAMALVSIVPNTIARHFNDNLSTVPLSQLRQEFPSRQNYAHRRISDIVNYANSQISRPGNAELEKALILTDQMLLGRLRKIRRERDAAVNAPGIHDVFKERADAEEAIMRYRLETLRRRVQARLKRERNVEAIEIVPGRSTFDYRMMETPWPGLFQKGMQGKIVAEAFSAAYIDPSTLRVAARARVKLSPEPKAAGVPAAGETAPTLFSENTERKYQDRFDRIFNSSKSRPSAGIVVALDQDIFSLLMSIEGQLRLLRAEYGWLYRFNSRSELREIRYLRERLGALRRALHENFAGAGIRIWVPEDGAAFDPQTMVSTQWTPPGEAYVVDEAFSPAYFEAEGRVIGETYKAVVSLRSRNLLEYPEAVEAKLKRAADALHLNLHPVLRGWVAAAIELPAIAKMLFLGKGLLSPRLRLRFLLEHDPHFISGIARTDEEASELEKLLRDEFVSEMYDVLVKKEVQSLREYFETGRNRSRLRWSPAYERFEQILHPNSRAVKAWMEREKGLGYIGASGIFSLFATFIVFSSAIGLPGFGFPKGVLEMISLVVAASAAAFVLALFISHGIYDTLAYFKGWAPLNRRDRLSEGKIPARLDPSPQKNFPGHIKTVPDLIPRILKIHGLGILRSFPLQIYGVLHPSRRVRLTALAGWLAFLSAVPILHPMVIHPSELARSIGGTPSAAASNPLRIPPSFYSLMQQGNERDDESEVILSDEARRALLAPYRLKPEADRVFAEPRTTIVRTYAPGEAYYIFRARAARLSLPNYQQTQAEWGHHLWHLVPPETVQAFSRDLESFIEGSPDEYEPLRTMFREYWSPKGIDGAPLINSAVIGAYPTRLHLGMMRAIFWTGGNLNLLPPSLRIYYEPLMNAGEFENWQEAMEWYRQLSPRDRAYVDAYWPTLGTNAQRTRMTYPAVPSRELAPDTVAAVRSAQLNELQEWILRYNALGARAFSAPRWLAHVTNLTRRYKPEVELMDESARRLSEFCELAASLRQDIPEGDAGDLAVQRFIGENGGLELVWMDFLLGSRYFSDMSRNALLKAALAQLGEERFASVTRGRLQGDFVNRTTDLRALADLRDFVDVAGIRAELQQQYFPNSGPEAREGVAVLTERFVFQHRRDARAAALVELKKAFDPLVARRKALRDTEGMVEISRIVEDFYDSAAFEAAVFRFVSGQRSLAPAESARSMLSDQAVRNPDWLEVRQDYERGLSQEVQEHQAWIDGLLRAIPELLAPLSPPAAAPAQIPARGQPNSLPYLITGDVRKGLIGMAAEMAAFSLLGYFAGRDATLLLGVAYGMVHAAVDLWKNPVLADDGVPLGVWGKLRRWIVLTIRYSPIFLLYGFFFASPSAFSAVPILIHLTHDLIQMKIFPLGRSIARSEPSQLPPESEETLLQWESFAPFIDDNFSNAQAALTLMAQSNMQPNLHTWLETIEKKIEQLRFQALAVGAEPDASRKAARLASLTVDAPTALGDFVKGLTVLQAGFPSATLSEAIEGLERTRILFDQFIAISSGDLIQRLELDYDGALVGAMLKGTVSIEKLPLEPELQAVVENFLPLFAARHGLEPEDVELLRLLYGEKGMDSLLPALKEIRVSGISDRIRRVARENLLDLSKTSGGSGNATVLMELEDASLRGVRHDVRNLLAGVQIGLKMLLNPEHLSGAELTPSQERDIEKIVGLIEPFFTVLNATIDAGPAALRAAIERIDAELMVIQPLIDDLERGIDPNLMVSKAPVAYRFDQIKGMIAGSRDIMALNSEPEAVSINEVLTDALRMTQSFRSFDPAQLSRELDPENPVVWYPPVRLRRVIFNLLWNAYKATVGRRESRRIGARTRVAPAGDSVEVEVFDNGTGIPQEILADIFELGVTTKGDKRDRGQGLWLAKEFIEEYGGDISVESEEGVGTKFTLRLPIHGIDLDVEGVMESGPDARRENPAGLSSRFTYETWRPRVERVAGWLTRGRGWSKARTDWVIARFIAGAAEWKTTARLYYLHFFRPYRLQDAIDHYMDEHDGNEIPGVERARRAGIDKILRWSDNAWLIGGGGWVAAVLAGMYFALDALPPARILQEMWKIELIAAANLLIGTPVILTLSSVLGGIFAHYHHNWTNPGAELTTGLSDGAVRGRKRGGGKPEGIPAYSERVRQRFLEAYQYGYHEYDLRQATGLTRREVFDFMDRGLTDVALLRKIEADVEKWIAALLSKERNAQALQLLHRARDANYSERQIGDIVGLSHSWVGMVLNGDKHIGSGRTLDRVIARMSEFLDRVDSQDPDLPKPRGHRRLVAPAPRTAEQTHAEKLPEVLSPGGFAEPENSLAHDFLWGNPELVQWFQMWGFDPEEQLIVEHFSPDHFDVTSPDSHSGRFFVPEGWAVVKRGISEEDVLLTYHALTRGLFAGFMETDGRLDAFIAHPLVFRNGSMYGAVPLLIERMRLDNPQGRFSSIKLFLSLSTFDLFSPQRLSALESSLGQAKAELREGERIELLLYDQFGSGYWAGLSVSREGMGVHSAGGGEPYEMVKFFSREPGGLDESSLLYMDPRADSRYYAELNVLVFMLRHWEQVRFPQTHAEVIRYLEGLRDGNDPGGFYQPRLLVDENRNVLAFATVSRDASILGVIEVRKEYENNGLDSLMIASVFQEFLSHDSNRRMVIAQANPALIGLFRRDLSANSHFYVDELNSIHLSREQAEDFVANWRERRNREARAKNPGSFSSYDFFHGAVAAGLLAASLSAIAQSYGLAAAALAIPAAFAAFYLVPVLIFVTAFRLIPAAAAWTKAFSEPGAETPISSKISKVSKSEAGTIASKAEAERLTEILVPVLAGQKDFDPQDPAVQANLIAPIAPVALDSLDGAVFPDGDGADASTRLAWLGGLSARLAADHQFKEAFQAALRRRLAAAGVQSLTPAQVLERLLSPQAPQPEALRLRAETWIRQTRAQGKAPILQIVAGEKDLKEVALLAQAVQNANRNGESPAARLVLVPTDSGSHWTAFGAQEYVYIRPVAGGLPATQMVAWMESDFRVWLSSLGLNEHSIELTLRLPPEMAFSLAWIGELEANTLYGRSRILPLSLLPPVGIRDFRHILEAAALIARQA